VTARCARWAVVLGLLATAATAQEWDGVAVDTLLPDADFFRLATCGAPPGGDCAGPMVRWPGRLVTVSLRPSAPPVPTEFTRDLSQALDHAIARINAVDMGLRLHRVETSGADIRVTPTDRAEGSVLPDILFDTAAGVMGVGYMSYWWDAGLHLMSASILISITIKPAELRSVVLEELYQSLGPGFDVDGAAYEGVSILSQSANTTTTITGQDAALLQWLYPSE